MWSSQFISMVQIVACNRFLSSQSISLLNQILNSILNMLTRFSLGFNPHLAQIAYYKVKINMIF